MLALSWWSIARYGKGNWVVLLLANLLINGYPIMLQRYNRIRINRALALISPDERRNNELGRSDRSGHEPWRT
jgi:hypothetical protein